MRPSPPTTGTFFGTLDISWDGLGLLGEPMPLDFDHVEVWVGQSSTFRTDRATETCAARLFGPGTHVVCGLPRGVDLYAALCAVDRTGAVVGWSDVTGPSVIEPSIADWLRDAR